MMRLAFYLMMVGGVSFTTGAVVAWTQIASKLGIE